MDAASIRDVGTVGAVRAVSLPDQAAPPAPQQQDTQSWPGSAVTTDLSKHAERLRSLAAEDGTDVKTSYERDPDTDTLVFKAVDGVTGDVVLQLPDASLLKFRAYLKQNQPAVAESTLTRTA